MLSKAMSVAVSAGAVWMSSASAQVTVDKDKGFVRLAQRTSVGDLQKMCVGARRPHYTGPTVLPDTLGRETLLCLPSCSPDPQVPGPSCDTIEECKSKGVTYCAAFTCPPVIGTIACAQIAVDNNICEAGDISGPGTKKSRKVCSQRAAAAGLCSLDIPQGDTLKDCYRSSIEGGHCPMEGSSIGLPEVEGESGCGEFVNGMVRDFLKRLKRNGAQMWSDEARVPVDNSGIED